ncbi:MAG: cadherin-like domain-containing protein, partial [Rubrivivax sp.]|nr:cadherin-like domain-containing protein [Rubrivivax sp.]
GLGTITYTWKADGSVVGTGNTYDVTEAEVGKVITVEASYTDGHGTPELVSSAATAAVVNVNDAPTTSPVVLTPIAEDSGPRLITTAELLRNAHDADGNTLVVTNVVVSGGNGTVVDMGNGTWRYTPAANDDTAVRFVYSIADGRGGSVVGRASLDITPVNDAPWIATPPPLTTDGSGPWAVHGLSVTDVDSGLLRTALSVRLGLLSMDLSGGARVVDGANLTSGVVLVGTQAQTDAALASLTYQPVAGQTGEDVLSVVATDADGATFVATVGIVVAADTGTSPGGLTGGAVNVPTLEPVKPQSPAATPTEPVAIPKTTQSVDRSDPASPGDTSKQGGPPRGGPTLGASTGTIAGTDGETEAGAATTGPASTTQRTGAGARDEATAAGDQPLLDLLGWSDDAAADGRQGLSVNALGTRGVTIDVDTTVTDTGAKDGSDDVGLGLGDITLADAAAASFTAGFVWWLTRSGGMLTMMLMGIPAWRHVDLLPVLARDVDDREDDRESPRKKDNEDTAFEHSAYEVRLDDLFESRPMPEEELR